MSGRYRGVPSTPRAERIERHAATMRARPEAILRGKRVRAAQIRWRAQSLAARPCDSAEAR